MDYGERPREDAALLVNGRFYTMDRRVPTAEAVFIRGDRIEAVGARKDVEAAADGRVRTLDLEGRCVIPGFIDAHVHVLGFGQSLRRVDLNDCRGVGDLLRRVREAAARLGRDDWVLGQGWRLEHLWKPGEVPDLRALDAATPRRPAMLWSKDLHAAWVNSAALLAAGITADSPDPPGGLTGREPSGRRLTGLLVDTAADPVAALIPKPSPQDRREAVLAAFREAHRWGVTGLHDVEGEASLGVYEDLLREGKLDMRIAFFVPGRNLDEVLTNGLRSGHGNEFLRFGGLKLFTDGSLGARSAAMAEPYDDDPKNTGLVLTEPEALRDLVRRANAGGVALAIHAIGDRAVRFTLDVLEAAVPAAGGRPLRHRIEHFQHVFAEDVARLKPLGVAASIQPCHLLGDMTAVGMCLKTRADRAFRFRSILEAGAGVALGTDAPVEGINPFRNLYAAVTRRREDGTPAEGWQTQERVTIEDAVRAYTLGSAWASGEEGLKGSISPGKLADLALLDRDIFTAPTEEVLKAKVWMTVVGGKVVWKNQ